MGGACWFEPHRRVPLPRGYVSLEHTHALVDWVAAGCQFLMTPTQTSCVDQYIMAARTDGALCGRGRRYEGGGLIRHVQLVAMDPVHIEPFGSWVHTNGSTFVTETTVENHGTAAASVAVKATVSESATGAVRATVTSNPVNVPAGVASSVVVLPVTWHDAPVQMWSVQTPNLYTVTFEVVSGTTVVDSLNITTGVRDVRFDADKGLFINEQRIKMRGFCDRALPAGAAWPLGQTLRCDTDVVL